MGDVITLRIPVEEGYKIIYQSYSGTVIGFLQAKAYTVDLNYAASSPNFSNMLMQHASVILTNDETLISSQDWRYPAMSLLVKAEEGKQEEAEAFLRGYGACESFFQIQQNSQEGFWTEFRQMFFPNLLMMTAVVYGVAGTTYLFVHRSRRALAIYEMCGQSAAGRRALVLCVNSIPMLSGFVCSVLLFCFRPIRELFYVENIFSVCHLLSAAVLMGIFWAVMCLCSDAMLRRTTIANMRRGE